MRPEAIGVAPGDDGIRFAQPEIANAEVGVDVVDTRAGLSAIHRPGCAAAIWRRRRLPAFQEWIDELDPETLPHARITLRPNMVPDAVLALCESCGTPDGDMRQAFVDDIAALTILFADLMEVEFLRMRLEAVASNACSKFHIDAVTARLICTYRGTGTQYGISTQGDTPRRVFTVPTGAPMILRGTLWPQSPPAGVLHRSPPIEGTGETRLVLVLDPAVDPQERLGS